ncbi:MULTISPECIES: GyrI-like domain-containing protein [Amycolatopsis]|uniref:Effector-binding domain-containing protein n=2 Tax=Amycolatopsis TaxID=1813 RepID=A0A1I3V7K9_9PSEU|nr:GyrI-like domain-containing protein [Amycolatopsis sacchari]SFJ90091.1 effector-binding domain-containing protein [Amycolatopsis sacchari]
MSVEPEIVVAEPVVTAVIRRELPLAELSGFFDSAFQALPATIAAQGIEIAGPAFALYRSFTPERVDVEIGFATDRPVEPNGEVTPGKLPGGRIARLVHVGGYDGLPESWQRLHSWLGAQKLRPGSLWWEVYATKPSPEMDPAELRTELYLPLED